MEVCPLSREIMLPLAQSLSTSLQDGLCFVQHRCRTIPDALRLRFYPARLLEAFGRERRASTFHKSDKYGEVRPILSAG